MKYIIPDKKYTILLLDFNLTSYNKDAYIRGTYSHSIPSTEFEFTGRDLNEAITLCGIPSISLSSLLPTFWKHIDIKRRTSHILTRINIILDALEEQTENTKTYLKRASSYNTYLDPSEKEFYSYVLGIIFTQLYVRKIKKIPFLLHFDLANVPVSYTKKTNSRPDFIGLTPNSTSYLYSIWEAKGRSGYFDDKAMKHGLEQAMLISAINGSAVHCNGCCQTFFKNYIIKNSNKIMASLYLYVIDPISENEEAITIDINQYFLMYYSQVMCFVDERSLDDVEMIGGKSYIKVDIPYSDNRDIMPIRIKIPKELYHCYMLSCKERSNALQNWINENSSIDLPTNFLIFE